MHSFKQCNAINTDVLHILIMFIIHNEELKLQNT